jgi:hypothetical protein
VNRRLVLLLLAPALLCAQRRGERTEEDRKRIEWIRENYTKHEFQIPMRDGVRLFTSVYAPKDKSARHPILMMRTPYSVAPYGIDNYRARLGPGSTELFMREKFIFVYQDVRGRNRSEGTFVHVRPFAPAKKAANEVDEASDTYDTIEWLLKNVPNHNGRVGMYGISYPGFYAAMGALSLHPALKATSPQAPVIDWFVGDDFRHNGVLFLTHAFNFLGFFGLAKPEENWSQAPFNMPTPDGYTFHLQTGALGNYDEKHLKGKIAFWKELLENDTYSGFWKARTSLPYYRDITAAMMTVGGWFDAEDVYGPLKLYESAEKLSPNANNILVEGPWSHGGWSGRDGSRLGNARFGSNTSEFFQEKVEFPFFLQHLKDKGDAKLPEAYVFETGRNEWHTMAAWPPREAKRRTLYFHAGGKLDWSAPAERGEAFDEYLSDPNKPVPFTPYITNRMDYNYMTDDQRFAAARPDVLVWQTEPLESDVRIAGPLKAALHVSTTGTDADFVVKLVDVFPGDTPDNEPNPENVRMGGYQMLLRGEPFRGKFRRSFEKPEPFTPGKVERIEFEMPDIFHTFRRGHRIMVQVQSSWYPLTDRNPQKFMPIHKATAADFQKAVHRVYRSAGSASSLAVMTLE